MACITPFDPCTSVATTFDALLILTPEPFTITFNELPSFKVGTLPLDTCEARTLPETTWYSSIGVRVSADKSLIPLTPKVANKALNPDYAMN